MDAPEAPRFDVFLSYSRRDETVVRRVAERLVRTGLTPWFDKWSLTPGGAWQEEMGAGLDASSACAVFIGPGDLGAWESQEGAVAVDRAAKDRRFRLIPVLLPGVEDPFDPNTLPHFLRARTWVDFRRGRDDPRALQDLITRSRASPSDSMQPCRSTSASPHTADFGRSRRRTRSSSSGATARSSACSRSSRSAT